MSSHTHSVTASMQVLDPWDQRRTVLRQECRCGAWRWGPDSPWRPRGKG